MATNKRANAWKDAVTFTAGLPKQAGYADYFLQTPVSFRINNAYSENLTVSLRVTDDKNLIVPYETTVEVPFEGSAEVVANCLFSPVTLAENNEIFTAAVKTEIVAEKTVLASACEEVTALPYDYWEGTEGNAERLAAFVRPRLSDCARVLENAGKRLKKWDESADFYGYVGTDKNAVRKIAAAIFAAMKQYALYEEEGEDLTKPCRVAAEQSIIKTKTATSIELAVFCAAVFEKAKLHPVIAVGKNEATVGVWLYDSCFPDAVSDDCETLEKYVSDGINNLAFFDAKDLFEGSNAAFTSSQSHFVQKLKAGYYEYFTDVKRCRLGGIFPLPLRGKSVKGYELVKEADLSDDEAPAPLYEHGSLGIDGSLPRNRRWERRLLDLTNKNALLNFTGKNALHICSPGLDSFYATFTERKELRLKGGAPEREKFGEEFSDSEKQLFALENHRGVARVEADDKLAGECASRLFKRNKEAAEESGAKVLYLAMGFLKYLDKEDGQERYAPLVLCPAEIKRAKGNEEFSLVYTEEEYFVNTTLTEYLKQEFNIDVRALGGDATKHGVREIVNIFLAETAGMRGWSVTNDVYVAAFSFQRYLMWHDLRSRFDEFKKNDLVEALLTRRAEKTTKDAGIEEDDADPEETLIPLPADSSQFSAIALSRTGKSFVLHGPPGTGKSQTITNIIANALEDNRRVLFVAEKKAALDVVKKRLNEIGAGDFCLELHSNKTDKADVVHRIETTLALKNAEGAKDLSSRAAEIVALREELKAPVRALHKKRRLGVSVYQALLLYLKNKDAPDVLNVENAFYDTLTEAKLEECKSKILSAAAAAKECGGVFNSPFENVNVSEYSRELRDRIYCAGEVVITEIRHFKSYLALYLDLYRQKISAITRDKIENLRFIAENLLSGRYEKYFSAVSEEEFSVFFNAGRRLDELLERYFSHFKTLTEIDEKEYEKLSAFFAAGGDYRSDKCAAAIGKKLIRAAKHPLETEDVNKYLQVIADIYEAKKAVTSVSVSKHFTDRNGNVNWKKRAEFMRDLTALHERCAAAFMDYNPDAFNGTCIRANNGYTAPVLEGFLKAAEAFDSAKRSFCAAIRLDESRVAREDEPDYFYSKASALIDNIDMLANWCMYKKTVADLKKSGCSFIGEALESGNLTGANVLAGFEKNVYRNFLAINIPADPDLARCSAGTLEETVEKFRAAWDTYSALTREKIRADLIARLPGDEEGNYGNLSVELSAFARLARTNLRGAGLRGLFAEAPELLRRACPCLLMSPSTVSQYLAPEANSFDLVIFDEASQLTTAEAIGAIARAKSAVIVGDPKQLPPTEFFNSAYVDEDDLENEDLESVLDDCLALGMTERHLVWHYRSKHESLIAFSNNAYYDNRLCTFPSPDAMDSKVKFVQVDGVYDRGFTKRNGKEAEALIAEVIRRLQDPALSRSSMGVVTFSSAQQNYIEKLLTKEIIAKKLESAAYDREEPLFVKNLENVQGDERDVILFSVCYGPDASGRVSLNFGPLNQAGGWRRLNVAVSRAREEMVVFSTMTAGMIDLAKTSSKGVAGLKNFLEFAERGKVSLAMKQRETAALSGAGIGKYIAAELSAYGYDCRFDVGASDFKIDVAVIDPKNKHEFILAVLCDANDAFSVKDRNILQVQSLKRANWNVLRINCVNYYNNPKREIKRVKEALDKLTGAEKKGKGYMRYAKNYRGVAATGGETAAFVTGGEHDAEIVARLKEIVAAEEPISRAFLKTRCLTTFGVAKSGARIEARLDALIDTCAFKKERAAGTEYFYKNDKALLPVKFRVENEPCLRRGEEDFSVYETVFLIRAALEEKVSLYFDELTALVCGVYKVKRPSEKFVAFLRDCVGYGEQKGVFVRSVSDRITLA